MKQIGEASRMSAKPLDLKHGEGQPPAPRSKLGIRVLNSLDELEKLRPAWEELLSHYPQASIFSTWEWLAPWWRAFGAGQQLHVLTFEDSFSSLVGLAPLSISTRRTFGKTWKILRLMGDGSGDSDNLDLPVIPGYEDDVVRTLIGHLEAHASLWDFCEFNTLPADSLSGERLLHLLPTFRYVWGSGQTPCASVFLPNNWEDYLKQLPSRIRTQYRSLARKFEGQNAFRLYRCLQQSSLDSCLEALFELHGKRWRSKGEIGSFLLEGRRKFYRDLSIELLRRNWLEFWLLELNGKAIAADYGFRYGDVAYALQSGFDPVYANDSPGFYLKGSMLKALIESGVRRYDFLGGYSDAKARWNAKPSNYVYIHFARPWSVGGLNLHLRKQFHGTKEWMRTHLPAPAWKLLHHINAGIKGPSK